MMEIKKFANRLKNIIYLEEPVREIKDIHRVFATDLNTAFKTVFKWGSLMEEDCERNR